MCCQLCSRAHRYIGEGLLAWLQAEALQQTRRELSQLEGEVQGQQQALEQLAAERDACKSGAHEAADRSKVCLLKQTGKGKDHAC